MRTRLFATTTMIAFMCCICATAQNASSAQESEVSPLNSINGHYWVDLGLSVRWATCNVGASSPEEYGDHFSWGEVKEKAKFTYENCSTNNLELTDIAGMNNYDAATTNWGQEWRIPTKEEVVELFENCECLWTSINGVEGIKLTSKINGNSIFIPAAGYKYLSLPTKAEIEGQYWISTSSNKKNADFFFFFSSMIPTYISEDKAPGKAIIGLIDDKRATGRSIRPVTEK